LAPPLPHFLVFPTDLAFPFLTLGHPVKTYASPFYIVLATSARTFPRSLPSRTPGRKRLAMRERSCDFSLWRAVSGFRFESRSGNNSISPSKTPATQSRAPPHPNPAPPNPQKTNAPFLSAPPLLNVITTWFVVSPLRPKQMPCSPVFFPTLTDDGNPKRLPIS